MVTVTNENVMSTIIPRVENRYPNTNKIAIWMMVSVDPPRIFPTKMEVRDKGETSTSLRKSILLSHTIYTPKKTAEKSAV